MKLIIEHVARHKSGENGGIFAICSTHPLVLEAALRYARDHQTLLLVEATSNQVDQYGGYTGMTPETFRDFLLNMADIHHFPHDRLILGGDHLGPNRWQHEPAQQAMEKAQVLIKSFVAAGFKKIHLDCSMSCSDDPVPLTDDIVAQRAALLASVAEQTCIEHFATSDLVYVIGTEVPVPGGAHEVLTTLSVTAPEAARETLKAHRSAFEAMGLQGIWPRVIALVVQPGVEFDNTHVIDYKREKSKGLSEAIESWENLVFEAHSTDYQNQTALRELVEDHFAILKVGPALTFALRETLFALAAIEKELLPEQAQSHLRETLENVMLNDPKHWQSHYNGDANAQRLARGFSFSDRIRYFWPDERVEQKVVQLIANLKQQPIPLPLLSQYLPLQSSKVRRGELMATPHEMLIDSIQNIIRQYDYACRASLID